MALHGLYEGEECLMALWLVPLKQRECTPFAYCPESPKIWPIELVVVHWTASPPKKPKTQHGDDPARIRRWLRGKSGRESSTHLVITRAGEILQGAPLDWRTWHSGGSKTWDGRGDVNHRSIGIDLENVGNLDRGTNEWVDSYGGAYLGPEPYINPLSEPTADQNRSRQTIAQSRIWAWEPYRVAQMVSFFQIGRQIVDLFPGLIAPTRWVGHAEIRATKLDPGPHFPWRTLKMILDGECEPGALGDWHPAERRTVVDA